MKLTSRLLLVLGLVLTLGVGCCLLASITLLPSMLELYTAKKWKL